MRKRFGQSATRALQLAAVVASVNTAATAARAEDWPSPGLDGRHTRLSGERSGMNFAGIRWSVAGNAWVLASPVVADGFALTADMNGSVRAIRADDGQLVWQVPLGSTIQGTPAIGHGRVFVPTMANTVVAVRLVDGRRLWARDVGGMVLSSPAIVGSDLVLAAGFPSKQVIRLSGTTGEIVWQSPPVLEQFSNTSPAVDGKLVVVGSQGGRYYAFDTDTGAPRWSYAADGVVNLAAPLIGGDRVYMAGGDKSNKVHAVDAATGTAVTGWPIELPAAKPDIAGAPIGRGRAVSSMVLIGNKILLQTRLDDAIDTNGDNAVDRFLARESVVALDAGTGAIGWERAIARVELTDPNNVPKFFVCPTPAAFGSTTGSAMVAAASSLAPTVFVLDAAQGTEFSRVTTAGPALASPVMANGRLITVAMNGTIEGIASTYNHPPAAPIVSGYARPLDAGDVTLRWLPATDPDAEQPSYEIRVDSDGELLESWQYQMFADPGVTSLALKVPLTVGVTYSYAVRARDGRGALSAWSLPDTFSVIENPAVTVGGAPAASLNAAAAAARPGDVITLGVGTYALTQTLNVGPGVSIQGAGPGRTTIDGTRLGAGISFDNSTRDQSSRLEDVTVSGAETCVRVGSGASGVLVRRVIIRDCRVEGINVRAGGAADIVNATLVGNPTAVHVAGTAKIKNSLLTDNAVALAVDSPGTLASSYNDLFGNPKDYQGLTAGDGDIARVVAFADFKTRDFRVKASQPSTDRGDPADDVGSEPAPNGGRINLGAFGGTAEAELTDTSTAIDGDRIPGAAPTADPHKPSVSSPDAPDVTDGEQVGCRVVAGPDGSGLPAAAAALAAALGRRRRRR